MIALRRNIFAAAIGAAPLFAQAAPIKPLPEPVVPPAKPFMYPAFTVDTLPNGMRFAVVENHELPLVIIRTAFMGTAGPNGVSFIDAPGKEGEWGLTLATLREGTTLRSAAQINDELADMGAEIVATAPVSFTPMWMRAVRSTWRPALNLLADMMVNPSFPEAGVSRVQASLANTIERPAGTYTNTRMLYPGLYGAESPYAKFATAASLKAITRDDILGMKDKYLRPQNAIIVIAGDVTVPEARKALTEAFGSWQRGGVTVEPIVPPARTPPPTTIYLRDSPGAVQSMVVIGQIVPGRGTPDAAAVEALGAVLGDFTFGAGSRIYNAVRIERGLSYLVTTQLAQRPIGETVPVYASLFTPAISTDTAVTVLVQVFRDLREAKPPTAAELDFSKQALVGRQPKDLERIEVIAGNVLASIRDRLPPGYLNAYPARISGLTLADVQAAARKYLDADHMVITVVGDRSKIEAPLRALGYPVVIVDK